MTDWIASARAALGREPVALVSILATEGSVPRTAGARMAVTSTGHAGTIGGGRLEHQAIGQARALLAHPPGSWRVQDYPLGPLLGQCCGGRVRLLVERLDPAAGAWLDTLAPGSCLLTRLEPGCVVRVPVDARPTGVAARGEFPAAFVERHGEALRPVQIYGAGHVGTAIAQALRVLPFSVAWFDTRGEMDAPGVTIVPEADLAGCIGDAPPDAAVLILTHDHALDYCLTAAALDADVALVGLIGSTTKRARFLSRLAADGLDQRALSRLICPIGLPGIAGKQPEVIAVAVAAQLLQLDRRTGDEA